METAEETDMADAVLEKLRLHCRRRVSGLVRMLREGELDVFDALAAAPHLAEEEVRAGEDEDFNRRRRAWLERYPLDWSRMADEEE